MAEPDAIIIGGGLAGLTSALACADRGLRIILVAETRPGSASAASAGVLGPSIGRGPKGGRVGRFMLAARDGYPRYLDSLRERTGTGVDTVTGALEVALNETHFTELRSRAAKLAGTEVLGRREAEVLEPALVPVAGALYHPRDGAVDAVALLAALRDATSAHAGVARIASAAVALAGADTGAVVVTLSDGSRLSAPNVVLAAGAWVPRVDGLPRTLPVRAVKGEIAIARGAAGIRRVVFGAGGYLVPRPGELLIGATSDEANLDADPTDAAARELWMTARSLLRDWPDVATSFASQRAGLRPMTPDGYPILGRDPDAPGLIYACGYSRNGVLIAPLAADCVSALVSGENPGYDLTAFSVSRFAG